MTQQFGHSTDYIGYLLIVVLGFVAAFMIMGKNRAFDPHRIASIYYVFMSVLAALKCRV